ncbi:transcription elongation factor B polypeptide 3 isoform X2 [Daktulosphaira vitifoliae]|nr:transcription elongation factor B polypeptide 3 isoform X2 [Daktulosphaira vitifoliae]
MYCITKLTRLPIRVQNLQKTGIGRVVNSLRKYDGNIGEAAKSLVIKWKNIVKIEESENFYQRDDNSEDEHHEVSSTNDNEELQINQSITSSVASTSYYNKNPEPEIPIETNSNDSDQELPRQHHHHDKSKYKKSKKEKDGKKRKEYDSSLTEEHNESNSSKKVKREHKSDKHDSKKHKSHSGVNENVNKELSSKYSDKNMESHVKKEKKRSHSDTKKDKHKSVSKHYNEKQETKSSHKDKNESKKYEKEKTSELQPSTSKSSNNSSKTFEEALLGIEVGKKKGTKSKNKDFSSQSSRSSSSEREISPPLPESKLKPVTLNPEELIANYKPLPQLDKQKKKVVEDIDPLASIMTTKNMRTKVYSGNKSTYYSEVPKLHDICIQIIKDNLDALEYTGGVPFVILEPILKYATPDQLYTLEYYNNYLIEDTGKFWEFHCKKEFRNKVPDNGETWRDFYVRCLEERETKLAKLRQNINANQAASTPVRKTQIAFFDTAVKPPRNIAKKQAKYQTSIDIKRNIINKSMMGENSTVEAMSANKKSTAMATGTAVSLSSTNSTAPGLIKKKKAPLMQKALQLIRTRYKR